MSTAQVTSVFSARETMTRTLNSIESSTRRLDKAFGSLRGRMRSAIEFNVVNRGMDMLWRGIHRVTNAIPDLIRRGEQWAATIDAITDATGMSARQASILAAVNQRVGGSNEALTRGLAAMAKSVYTQRDAWKDMGVAVALNRDGSVDAYRTFQNLRNAIAATGGSLLSTAAAQKVLSRSGKDLLDLLQLTPRQYRMLARDAQRSGQVMSDAAVKAAEAWERAQQRFGATLDGLGTKILNGLSPVLTRFVDGFSDFVQRNMDNLVRLVVGGANTILTVVGDLLGIDLGSWSFTEQVGNLAKDSPRAAGGLRDISKATKEATKSHRDHNAALREQTDLQRNLRRAQADLARERSRTALFSRMSGVDAELWRQQKAARIKDAQDRVAQARKALTEHRQTLGQMEQQAATSGARIRGALRLDGGGAKKGGGKGGGAGGGIFGDLGGILRESTQTGHQIAEALRDAIFGTPLNRGTNTSSIFGGLGPSHAGGERSGGLVGALQGVQSTLQAVAGHVVNLGKLLDGSSPLVLGLGLVAARLLLSAATGAAGGLGNILSGALGAAAGAAAPWVAGGAMAAGAIGFPLAWLAGMFGKPGGMPRQGLNSDNPMSPDLYRQLTMPGKIARGMFDFGGRGSRVAPESAGPQAGFAPPPLDTDGGWNWRGAATGSALFGFPRKRQMWGPASMGTGFGPDMGFGVNPASGIGLGQYGPFGAIFRRYLGPTSPMVAGQDDQTGALGSIYDTTNTTAGNTQPINDGTLGVQNPKFGDIGQINGVKGNLPVESGKTLTVWTPGGKKLPTSGGGGGGGVPDWTNVKRDIHATRNFSQGSRDFLLEIRNYQRLSVAWLHAIAQGKTMPIFTSSTRVP